MLGLSLGMAVFMTLFLYIQNEYSFERSHKNLNQIYRVEQIKKDGDQVRKKSGAPPPLSLAIVNDFPEIKRSTRFVKNNTSIVELPGGSKIGEKDIIFADVSFLEIFTYPVIKGDYDGNLNEPFMAMITRETAEKYFGHENAVGKTLKINNAYDVEVRSVVEKPSENSHLNFNILISFNTILSLAGPEIVLEDWYSNWTYHFLLVDEEASINSLNAKLADYLKKYQGEESENILYITPLRDMHLKSAVIDDFAIVGDIQNVTIYSIIGILILMIAVVNYINLTTAYSTVRSKEVGIRKTTGASRGILIKQFLGESYLTAFLSLIIAAILLEFIVPYFNTLVNRSLDVDYLDNQLFTLIFIGIALLTGILSGFYPAILLSRFSPTTVLRSNFISGYKNPLFRKVLVVFQFFISVALISTAIFFIKQLNFLKNKELGFDKEEIIFINLSQSDQQKLDQFRTELTSLSSINYIGCSDYLPMNSTNWTVFTWEGASDDDYMKMNINYIDPQFLNVYNIQLISGSGFTREMADQDQLYVLLNEKAVKDIGWQGDAVGKKIRWMVDYRTRNPKEAIVAGVTSDFHYLPKHQPINPLIMPLLNKDVSGSSISVKLTTSDINTTLNKIENVFKDIYPEEIWNFEFTNQVIDQLYREESNLSQLVKLFTGIAILITTMGLFGLISFSTNQRIKEIGIRKVMGANVYNVVGLLSKEMALLLIIANILAWPSAFFLIKSWLQNFVYHIDINIYIFIGATILSFLIALLTAGFKILRAASTNPVKSLRYE